ncbi:MAG TPA: carboxypeptidase regulatory-like domain-containing protein [Jatrophihabitans sp.]|jgi:5-hydroxyisourate hydrolase-like protein (transthyretin family)
MRVEVTPRQANVVPGIPLSIAITITNTNTVIGGYAVRMLGADPGWIELQADQISLFPDESRTITATITAPSGIPAGARRIAIQVRELTPPEASSITELDLTVPAARSLQLRLDPLAITAGRAANFSLVVENTGNTSITGYLSGDDPEGKVRFRFEPERVSLTPGEHSVVDLRATARRHITGSPAVRMLGIYLDEVAPDAFFSDSDYAAADSDQPTTRAEQDALATGTFVQRAVLSRGPLSLLGLLAAVTVFAVVITLAMSRLVGQSAADRNLALQVAAARNASATTGTSGVAGTVHLLTSGTPVRGVSVSVFNAADTSTAIATSATDSKGVYQVGNLAAGKYKLSFRGAGFVQLWYPGAATDADATTVTLAAGEQKDGVNVSLGGVPATISGTVKGDDVSTSTLYLEKTTPAATNGAFSPAATTAGSPDGGAIVSTVPVGSDGTFTLTNVPSPSVYQLVVTKTGYATSVQRIDIGAGETRTGVQLLLSKGDGLMSGVVNSPTGPLGGATITATAGQATANTVSLTDGQVGTFTLRSLPTPGSFTVVASKAGFASQTLTLTMSAGQKLSGVSITLGQSSGSLAGLVTQLPSNNPAAGVAVTVTDGQLTVQTETESTAKIGAWQVGGLPVPGTYTVTFTRRDLAAQTVSVSLDAAGNITPGSQGTRITADGISVGMQSATAVVYGTTSQPGGATVCNAANAIGEATVTLNSGASSYAVTSASQPNGKCGQYRIEQVPAGTYTLTVSAGSGTSPSSQVITVQAGDSRLVNVALARPASLSGTVVSRADGAPQCGWTVQLFQVSQYPTTVTATTTTDRTPTGNRPCRGAFGFTGIPAGNYILSVGSTPGNAAATVPVTVQPSQQLTNLRVEVP